MERRRERRIPVDQDVLVTLLGPDSSSYSARTVDQSGRGLQIRLDHPLPDGVPVKIEMEDALLLAEVCFCHPVAGGYLAGLQVDQILSGLSDLNRLNLSLGFGAHGDAAQLGPRRMLDWRV